MFTLCKIKAGKLSLVTGLVQVLHVRQWGISMGLAWVWYCSWNSEDSLQYTSDYKKLMSCMTFHTTVPLVLTIILRNPTHGSVHDELHWIGDVTDNLQNYNKHFFCFIYFIIEYRNISCHSVRSCCHCNFKRLCIIEVHPCNERQVHTTTYTVGNFTRDKCSRHLLKKTVTKVLCQCCWIKPGVMPWCCRLPILTVMPGLR